VLDIIVGGFLLILSTPLIVLAAIAVRLETRGNPFFIQTRIGLRGKPFKILKLRGMYIDAQERFPELYAYEKLRGLNFFFHFDRDPRVTRVGEFTRRTSIDELPNLVNVVLGDMSLVGPRPEIPEVMALYGDYAEPYLSVTPGVTCLSKVTGRDQLTKEETIKLDLNYVDRMSLALDALIVWKTFSQVAAALVTRATRGLKALFGIRVTETPSFAGSLSESFRVSSKPIEYPSLGTTAQSSGLAPSDSQGTLLVDGIRSGAESD
jgi:lipopolysaccharide/colanic/teichoic acid biosynthesis glycosyltransferase